MTHPPPLLLEAAIDSAADAERAVREGADRLEVCAALDLGGLTPSPPLLRDCLTLGVPCVAMARPRGGHHRYDAADLARVRADVEAVLAAGAHGVVFGALTPDGRVHVDATRAIVERCAGAESVFHRAFDETPELGEALDALISRGVTRVLTSGGASTALDGTPVLVDLVRRSRRRIQILAGGSLRAANVREIVTRAGVTQVHARASEPGVIAGLRDALSVLDRERA